MRRRRRRFFDDEGWPESMDLGPCCACQATGPTVRNIVMLPRRAPISGTGWGCLQCGLPRDGASAILCDACLESGRQPTEVVLGYAIEKGRAPIVSLAPDVFDHRMELHPEESP